MSTTVLLVLAVCVALATAAPNLGDKINDAAKKLDKIADNICFVNENCNTFWTLKNYCCTPQCCDVISYITRNE